MYQYQNISGVDQTITADGDINPRIVKPGESTESTVPIENPNFKFIGQASQDEPAQPSESTDNENNQNNEEGQQ